MFRHCRYRVIVSLLVILLAVSGARAQERGWSEEQAADQCDSLCIVPTRTISFETTEGTQMNVDVSPDGGTILFDLLGDIYTVPRTGGTATRLTSGMAMDLQPVFSPDGRRILFVSDRSGNENLWTINADGTNPTPVTTDRGSFNFDNPEWSPDGEYVLVQKEESERASRGGRQPWLVHVSGGPGMELAKEVEGIGFRWAPDGQYVYFRATEARDAASAQPGNAVTPRAQIMRLDRRTGDIAPITTTPSGGARPAISPDGKWMVYVSEVDAMSGLRLRNLVTDDDQWLAFPIDREALDHRTRFTFTPDGNTVIFVNRGTFHEVDIRTKQVKEIPFVAKVEQQLGPRIYHEFPFRDDSLVVRNVRYGGMNRDRTQLVFGSLNQLWIMDLPAGKPRPLIQDGGGQYQPTFSPDGSSIAYVSWHETEGGHIWRVPTRGGEPQRLTTHPAYYANPAWSPDGSKIVFVREDPAAIRVRSTQNRGIIEWIPSSGGEAQAVVSAPADNVFTFTGDGTRITFAEDGTLVSVRLDGMDRREVAKVEGAVEMVPSPDGSWLAFTLREEVYVAALPPSAETVTIEESSGPGPVERVTREGGQDLRWEDGGKTLTWVFGNTFSYLDLSKVFGANRVVEEAAAGAPDSAPAELAEVVPITLIAPMPRPDGTIALTGATVVTMRGDEVLEDATIVVTSNRISAIGPSRSVRIPDGARVIDVEGENDHSGAHRRSRAYPGDAARRARGDRAGAASQPGVRRDDGARRQRLDRPVPLPRADRYRPHARTSHLHDRPLADFPSREDRQV